MKRISFIIIFFLLSTSVFYGFELKLEDKYSFHYESRKIDYLNFFYFHDFLIFNDIYYVRNNALVPIFNLNEDFYNFYAKYEISCELLMNRNKK